MDHEFILASSADQCRLLNAMHKTLQPCAAALILASVLTSASLLAQTPNAQPPIVLPPADSFLETLESLGAAHQALLKSGICSGRLSIELKELDDLRPSTLVDCNFKIVFDGERVRLEREYFVNNLKREHQRGAWGLEAQGNVRSILIQRGAENYWVRFDGQAQATCYVLNQTWCHKLFQNIDSPASHPARVWENAFRALGEIELEFVSVPLRSTGILARARKGPLSVECYLVPPDPLRLLRLSFKHGTQGFVDYNLEWQESNGVMFVEHYLMRRSAMAQSAIREYQCLIDYTDFQANVAVDQEQFELTSLGVAAGTVFRANAPVPAEFIFDGTKLIPAKKQ